MKFETKKAMKKLSELKFAPYNPRIMTERMKIKLKNSIDKFGYVEPIVWNKRTGNVVGGNQRLEVIGNSSQGKDIGIEVVVVDIPEKEEKALNLALNKISGDWDTDKLTDIFNELDDDILDYTGFEEDEISKILDEDIKMKEDDFDVEKSIQKPKYEIKLGEVWKLGNHRLMCGDSTKKEDVEKLMDGKKADMVFTDPPYNVAYQHGFGRQTMAGEKPKFNGGIKNDNMSDGEYLSFLEKFIENLKQIDGDFYICMGTYSYKPLLNILSESKIKISSIIIWVKEQFTFSMKNYHSKYEGLLYGWIKKSSYNGPKNETDIWEIHRDLNKNYQHPTQKPIELAARAIKNSSKKEDIILDLFGGSGSTLIACEQLNRKCYMMEIDPIYCSVIIERWEKFTGKKAEVVNKNDEKQKIQ